MGEKFTGFQVFQVFALCLSLDWLIWEFSGRDYRCHTNNSFNDVSRAPAKCLLASLDSEDTFFPRPAWALPALLQP